MTNTEVLRKAKQVLLDKGWCKGHIINEYGGHCALGAVYQVVGGFEALMARPSVPALDFLIQALPVPPVKNRDCSTDEARAWAIANYNNSQGDVAPVLTWFDRAAELAEAAEMYQELYKLHDKPAAEHVIVSKEAVNANK